MHKHESAFTLIELMITLAVAAVVLTLGVPSFNNVIERNQLTAHINELVATLNFARSEAVKRNSSIRVCQSSDGISCGGTGYEEGWIIFSDVNEDGDYADPGEELIRVNEGLPSNYTMRTNSLSSFVYNAKGRASNGRIVLCKENLLNKSRAIFIRNNGRTRLAPLDANSIPEEAPGDPIAECTPPWT
ncbi:MAG: GspH/FimT family pseudopilin [Pseudomonadota bacterium]